MKSFISSAVALTLVAQTSASDYYGPWWSAPDGAIITKLESTMIAPANRPDGAQGQIDVWPGLQPSSGDFVYQNIFEWFEGAPWKYFTEICCTSADPRKDYGSVNTNPGDAFLNTFSLNTGSGEWSNTWSADGHGNGGTNDKFPSEEPLTGALFVVEVHPGATWDFGDVQFNDITIVANNPDTSWCNNPKPNGNMKLGDVTSTSDGSSSTCYISSLTLSPP